MKRVYCGGHDGWVWIAEEEITRRSGGGIQFQCLDCRTINTNKEDQ